MFTDLANWWSPYIITIFLKIPTLFQSRALVYELSEKLRLQISPPYKKWNSFL